MVNLVRGTCEQLTDFNPGSVTRALLEASAIEHEELYLQMYHGIVEAIPVAIYGAFDFGQQAAVAAYGYVIFYRETPAASDIVMPSGTRVTTTTGLSFVTAADATLLTGQYNVSAVARCETAGAIGTVAAGAITVLTSALTGIDAVTNPAAFTTGADAETDEARKNRFREYIATLARGTKAAVEYGAKTAQILTTGVVTEYVSQARCIEYDDDPMTPIGAVRVVIYNGASGASGDLVAEAQRIVDGYDDGAGTYVPGWKAAGIVATVEPAALLLVDVVESLSILGGYDAAAVLADVEAAQRAYVATLGIGLPLIHAELIGAAMAVPGVYNCIITTPVTDVATSLEQVVVIGSVTATEV